MSSAGFIVSFDGPGVQDGRIDVRDLAPALMSLGRMIDAANLAVNGEKRPIEVEVRAVSVGSFAVHLDAVLSGWDLVKSIIDRGDVEEAKKLLEWLGLFGATPAGTLFLLYRWLNGCRPEKVVRQSGNQFRFEIEGRTLVVPFEVMRLYQDRAVNQAVGDLLKTIRNDTIDRIEFFEEDCLERASEVLTIEDQSSFRIDETKAKIVVDTINTLVLSIRSLAFQEGNKWRLFDGQNVITANIEDEGFLDRVDRNVIRFAKGDILLCQVRTVQKQLPDGLKTEHTVLRVVEHRQAPDQVLLPFAEA